MEIQLTETIIFSLFLTVAGFIWKLHSRINDLEKDLAVNAAKDQTISDHIGKLEKMIEGVAKMVYEIREELARQKGGRK